MKALLTATALIALTSPALAGTIDERKPFPPEGYQMAPGDCRGGVTSMFQQTSDGLYNCPDTAWEKKAGEFIVFSVISGAILQGAGVVDIPAELGALKPF